MRDGRLLMDFHSFPLRIMEVADKPQEAILKLGFSDGIYGRSKGNTTRSLVPSLRDGAQETATGVSGFTRAPSWCPEHRDSRPFIGPTRNKH